MPTTRPGRVWNETAGAATSASSRARRSIPVRTSSAVRRSPRGRIRSLRSSAAPTRAWRPRSSSTSASATLFVVRNAGQVISDSAIASLEYAVAVLNVPLILVLGHDACGAVAAAIESQAEDADPLPPHIAQLIAPIVPAVHRVAGTAADQPVVPSAVDASEVGRSTCATPWPSYSRARRSSATPSPRNLLAIVGANYRLARRSGRSRHRRRYGRTGRRLSARALTRPSSERINDTVVDTQAGPITASSTTRWARCGFPPTPSTARRRSAPSRTSRSPAIGLEPAQIVALARIKKAAALANARARRPRRRRRRRHRRRRRRRSSAARHDGEFPIDVYQTGSRHVVEHEHERGAGDARLPSPRPSTVHPNDHVNASQSSNDVFPTSVHVAVDRRADRRPHPRARPPRGRARGQGRASGRTVVKSGRTHLMDATPVTLGQEFGGYARADPATASSASQSALPRVAEVPLGGTAVGTGINTPLGFPQQVIELLAAETELPITEARDHFEAQAQPRRRWSRPPAPCARIAVSLTKICNDLRWMGSGPNTGLGELHIPDLQPGSSIMPGKVNPVIPEAVLMVARARHRQRRHDRLGRRVRLFELNVAIPVMGTALLESIRLLDATPAAAARRQDRRRARGQRRPRSRVRRVVARRS